MSNEMVNLHSGTELPAYTAQISGKAGLENLTANDLVMPRVGICQSMTPQRKVDSRKYIPGLEEGNFFNALTREVYGPKIEVVPVLFSRSRALYADPDKKETGVQCFSRNGIDGGKIAPKCADCECSKWQGSAPPECQESKNFVCLILPKLERAILPFRSSGITIANEWASRLLDLEETLNKPIFIASYTLEAVSTNNGKGSYYSPAIQRSGFVDEQTFLRAAAAYRQIQGRDIEIADDVDNGAEPAPEENMPF